jgi:hypothetical protein
MEKGRPNSQRMDRRTNIVVKAWQSQFRRASASTDGFAAFEQVHPSPGPRERNRGGQPIWTAADNYRIAGVRIAGPRQGRRGWIC